MRRKELLGFECGSSPSGTPISSRRRIHGSGASYVMTSRARDSSAIAAPIATTPTVTVAEEDDRSASAFVVGEGGEVTDVALESERAQFRANLDTRDGQT